MPDPISKTQRWLDLIALLLGRKLPLSVDEIMERVPAYARAWSRGEAHARTSARRMFERDKDGLRAAGIPIETVSYRINYGADEIVGYRIARNDFYLPYLRILQSSDEDADGRAPEGRARAPNLPSVDLTPAEAELAIEALRRVATVPAFPFAADARSALRKLSFDVGPERLPSDSVVWVERPGASELLELVRTLSDALLARKRVRFLYHGISRGKATERDVAPYGLFFQRDWYLVGHARSPDALRIFRVARIEHLEPETRAPKRPDYTIPSDFRLEDYLNRSAWELGDAAEVIAAEVRFDFPLSILVARNGQGEPVEESADGTAVRVFRVASPNPFLRWVLSLGAEAKILSPPELVAGLDEMAREVAALYGADEGAGAHG